MKKFILLALLFPLGALSGPAINQDRLVELHHSVIHVLLEVLDATQESLAYWEISYFKNPNTETLEKINYLKQKSAEYCFQIGKLRNLHFALIHKKNPLFLTKLATCISECTGRAIILTELESNTELVNTTKRLFKFRQAELKELSPVQKPSHFQSHWQKYATGTAAALLVGYVGYRYADQLGSTAVNIRDTTSHFMNANIIQPTKEFLGWVYNEDRATTPEVMETRKNLNIANREDYTKSYHSEIPNPEQIARDSKLYNKMINEDWNMQCRNTTRNIMVPWGSLGRIFALKWSDVEGFFDFMQDYLESARSGLKIGLIGLGVELTALHACIGYIAGSAIYKKFRKETKRPIQHILHTIYTQLNINTDSAEDEYRQDGILHYWVQKLKAYTSALPFADRGAFLHDIEILDSPKTCAEAKVRTIEQMYRRYPVLQKMYT